MLRPDLISDRLRAIDASGIRRVFDLAATLKDPINLSIGQPDFDVPQTVKNAAADAIARGVNRYTQTQGLADLRQRITAELAKDFPGRACDASGALRDDLAVLITSGVSGGLLLAFLATLQPGDEIIIPDPYFVMYRHLVTLTGAKAVYCDTYPDFQLTAERVAPLMNERTKLLIVNSPANPTGVVADEQTLCDLANLCTQRHVLLLSDEIYDRFYFDGPRLPSPLDHADPAQCLLLKGFSKTYGMTGWRLGYAVGPKPLIEQMTKLQQYTFVCAPSMVQVAGALALDVDMTPYIDAYRRKRDRVVERLSPHFELTIPGGAFYAFPKVPTKLNQTGTQFVEAAIARRVLIIPGSVFSARDTHFRLSFACDDATLERGLDALIDLATQG